MELARRFAAGQLTETAQSTDAAHDRLIAWGVDAALADSVRQDARTRLLRPVELHPAWAAGADLFLACATQWRRTDMGIATGLDYGAVAAVAGALALPFDAAILADLQAMEAEALGVWNRRVEADLARRATGGR